MISNNNETDANEDIPNTSSSDLMNQLLSDLDTDFLCDRTVQFMESGDVRHIVAVELAEQSMYFERLLRYHKDKGIIQLPEFLNSQFSSVIEFIRTGKTKISEENVYNLFIASDFLLISNLKHQCIDFVKQVANDPSIAIPLWISCRETYWPELGKMAYEKILEHFELGCRTKEFLDLCFEDVEQILSDDKLNCNNECILLDVIAQWISANPEIRNVFTESLMSCIRFGLLSPIEFERLKPTILTNSNIPRLAEILDTWPNSLTNTSNELIRNRRNQFVTPRIPNEALIVLGGWCDGEGPRAAAQVFDPRANKWTLWSDGNPPRNPDSNETYPLLGNIPRRVYAGCVVVNQKVYLVGGFDGQSALKSTLCYDFRTDSGWYEISCMYEKRYYVSVAYAKGYVYAIGGHNGENLGRLNTAERFNIEANLWHPISPMNRIRSDASSAELMGKVYVCGGFEGRQYHSTAECYDADINQWSLITRMVYARGGVTLAQHNNFLYAIGGNDGSSRLRTVERYDPSTGRWEIVGNMTRRKSNLSSTVINDDIYIVGGWSDEPEPGILDLVEKFNVRSRQSTPVHPLCFPASATCSCTLKDKDLVTKYIKRNLNPEQRIERIINESQIPNAAGELGSDLPDLPDLIDDNTIPTNTHGHSLQNPVTSSSNRRSQRRRRSSRTSSANSAPAQASDEPVRRTRRRTLDRG